MSLSMKNQWMDDEGRAYIYYSLEDIMEALGCSNKKAISIMKELDTDAGIGLIEKEAPGAGKTNHDLSKTVYGTGCSEV